LFIRVVEISQGCSSIRITMDPDALPSTIKLEDIHCTATLYLVVSAQDSERRRPPLSLLLARAYRELVENVR
jgi:hypothetical protein